MRLLLCLVAVLIAAPVSAQFDEVGSLQFPTSAKSAEAQRHFLRGVAVLHSFGWKQAIEQFQAAQQIEPDFAMAYWGETLSYNHPLFGMGRLDEDNPRAVLARLGATRDERTKKTPTDREQGFLEAVEILWGTEGSYDERRVGYMEAMERLYNKYPQDHEVATFYALSMLSGSRALGDQSLRLEVKAGTIASRVFNENPDHPGAPHYTIHAFDDPIHAPLALDAAYRYAEIAPAVAHARHMPTHIFIQHGMWKLVSDHNQTAYEAARALWMKGDSVGDSVHPLDWGQYGDLQRGDYAKARTWITRLEQIVDESDGQQRAVNTLPLLNARYVVETEHWKTVPITDKSSVQELFATGLSAVRTGEIDVAKRAQEALDNIESRTASQTRIAHQSVLASILAAEGKTEEAISAMDEAIAVVETLRPPNGAASQVKPPYELYGEILLQLGRPEDALEKFEHSLLRMPNRMRSVLGSARAASEIDDTALALQRYETLANFWVGAEGHRDYVEAQRFIHENSN